MRKLIPAQDVAQKLIKDTEDIPVELLASHYEDLMVDNVEYYTKNGLRGFVMDVSWDNETEQYYYGDYVLSSEIRKELKEKYNISKEAQISACFKITRKMRELGYSVEYIGGDMNKMVIRW